MDKVKFQKLAEEMKNFTSDFCFAESNDVKDFTAKLIVSTATELIAAAGATPKKSEMPCNCRQEKTLPEFAAKTASCVFEVPKYKEEVVPAILVPLQEALDETKAQSTDKQNYVYMVFRVGETGAR